MSANLQNKSRQLDRVRGVGPQVRNSICVAIVFALLLGISQRVSAVGITDGLVGWWRMEDGINNTVVPDSSGHGRDAVIYGQPVFLDSSGARGNGAVVFDGKS